MTIISAYQKLKAFGKKKFENVNLFKAESAKVRTKEKTINI